MATKKSYSAIILVTILICVALLFTGIQLGAQTAHADEQVYPTEMVKTEFFFARLSGFYNDFKSSVSNKNMSVSETLYGVNLSVLKGTGSTYPYWTAGSGCYFTIKNGNQVKVSRINGDRLYGILLYGNSSYSLNAGSGESSYEEGAPKFIVTADSGEVTNNGNMIGWTGSANEVTFTFSATKTAANSSFQMEKLYTWSSSEVITAPAYPTVTADVSALADGFNTSSAKTVYFGEGTTTTNTESAPLTWKVVGYNGEGVASKPGTMTLMADDILLSDVYMSSTFSYESLNYYNTISSDKREWHAYGVSNINEKLIEKANDFSSAEKNAIYKRSLFDSLAEAYNTTMWMPSQNEVYLVDSSIKDTNSFSTRTFKVSSGSAYVVTYSSSGWNKLRISKVQNLNIRPMIMVDLSKVESVTEGSDGVFTFNFVQPPHEHSWEYAVSADGEKLVATCAGEGCTSTTQELSLNIEDRDYDESSTHAFINTNNWQAQDLLSTVGLEVKYVGSNGTTYEETATPPSDAGTYKAQLTIDSYTIEKEYTISPINVSVPSGMNPEIANVDLFKTLNAPSYEIQVWFGKAETYGDDNVVYDGNPHAVVHTQTSKDGVNYGYSYLNTEGGRIVFSVGDMNGPWTMTPTITEAGDHKVYWKVEASNGNYIGTEANSANYIYGRISKAESELITAPTAKANLTYNGEAQDLVNAGSANGGTVTYKIGSFGTWSSAIPQATEAGSYDVYYRVLGDNNHNSLDASESNKVTVVIEKANRVDMTALTVDSFTDVTVTLDTVSAVDGEVKYGYSLTENGEFTYGENNVISGLEDNTTYFFKYKVVNSDNFNDYESSAISVKTLPSDTTLPQITGVEANVHYCTPQTITIVEENLLSVTLDGVDVTDDLVDGNLVISVKASAQTVVVTDLAGNSAQITIKVLGHVEGSWIVDTVPKIGVAGSKHTECSICEETMSTAEIPALVENATEDTSVEKTDAVIGENAPETEISNNISEIRESVLTKDDEEAIANGATVDVYIEVQEISNSVSTETVNKVKEKVGEEAEIVYLDLNLYKKIGDNDATSVHNLNSKIKITVAVPDSLKADGRTYQIVRVHDGVAEIIDGQYNAETGEFTFETDRFSTYALTYVVETSTPDAGTNPDTPNSGSSTSGTPNPGESTSGTPNSGSTSGSTSGSSTRPGVTLFPDEPASNTLGTIIAIAAIALTIIAVVIMIIKKRNRY